MKINDTAAGLIANGILKAQRKFANLLENISASWKTKQQWIFLIMVCLVFGGLSAGFIIRSFSGPEKVFSKPSAIKTTRNIHNENSSVRITDDEFRRVQAFKGSLDSLSKKKLLKQRPGLLDSIEMVEQLYHSPKK